MKSILRRLFLLRIFVRFIWIPVLKKQKDLL